MLLPFDFAILTVDEAHLLVKFIQTQTSTKGDPRNYKKMQELGVLDLFYNLEGFIRCRNQNEELQNLDVDNIKMEE